MIDDNLMDIQEEFPMYRYNEKGRREKMINEIDDLVDGALVIVANMKSNYLWLNNVNLGGEIHYFLMLHIEAELKKFQICIKGKQLSKGVLI